MPTAPRISIVTTSFNQAHFLEATLQSIHGQEVADLEHIVIDGGSTDGSVDVIRSFSDRLAYWISEKDRGQVHALNKGLERATGDLFAFINSDDLLLPGALSAVLDRFDRCPRLDWLCGDVLMFGEGFPTRLVTARVPRSAAHCLAWDYEAPQPGHFWKRALLTNGFSEEWNYAFDHELYVRLLLRGHQCKPLRLPVAAYRLHPTSKTVAGHEGMEAEYDRIAEAFEPCLGFTGRRWSRAIRHLRRSWTARDAGSRGEAVAHLLRAAVLYPEGLAKRPFWGCLRHLST